MKERDVGDAEEDPRRLPRRSRAALAGRAASPIVEIPDAHASRTPIWNKKKRHPRDGRRDAPSVRSSTSRPRSSSCRRCCTRSTIKDLIEAAKDAEPSRRVLQGASTRSRARRRTPSTRRTSRDPILEDLEVALGALREELHVFAENRGSMVGNITIVDKGDEIDCRRMGSGGYALPSIVEPDVIQFKKCEAKFVLHVEKGTVWNRFNEDRFWEKHNCILTHGAGPAPARLPSSASAAEQGAAACRSSACSTTILGGTTSTA
jgi:DNA topoisomerase-6 subunit A